MYHRILVPIDGTEPAQQALHEAIRLARHSAGWMRLIYVVEDAEEWEIYHAQLARRVPRSSDQYGQSVLSEAMQLVESYGLRVSAALRYAEGRPICKIVIDEAALGNADLIVMCSRGGFSLGPFLFGSVAKRVAHRAKTPVLVLRHR